MAIPSEQDAPEEKGEIMSNQNRLLAVLAVSLLSLGLFGCAHHDAATTAQAVPGSTTVGNDPYNGAGTINSASGYSSTIGVADPNATPTPTGATVQSPSSTTLGGSTTNTSVASGTTNDTWNNGTTSSTTNNGTTATGATYNGTTSTSTGNTSMTSSSNDQSMTDSTSSTTSTTTTTHTRVRKD